MSHTRRVARTLLVVAVALAAATLAPGQAAACSCAGGGAPEDVVAAAQLAFIGTVVDTAPGGPSEFGGSNVRYAFDVEQASAQTDQVVVVQALDDGGGAACGFTFGVGERWLVFAYRQGADLETNLCSMNQRPEDMPAGELAAYAELLPKVPPEQADPPPSSSGADVTLPVAAAVAVLSALGLGAVAFRATRGRSRPPVT